MNQTILWTTLPNGVSGDGSTLRLSVLVSPRLDAGPGGELLLQEFPAFASWPEQKLGISLQFGNQAPVPATIVGSQADPDLWAALFPKGETTVRSFVPPDFSKRRIHSFPVANIVDYLGKIYSAVGVASPSALPTLAELDALGITEIATVAGSQNEFWSLEDERLDELEGRFKRLEALALPPQPLDPPMDFFRAFHFHRFRGGQYEERPKPPEPDFHEAVAYLGSHPFLLRRLGLLIDVEVAVDGQPPGSTVHVSEVEHEFVSDDRPLRTRYELDLGQGRFLAAPGAASELANGMLRLASGDYPLVQVDVDGAALKAIQFANQLHLRKEERLSSADSPTDDSLPALRSGGIAVARTGRAVGQSEKFGSVTDVNGALDPADPPELSAEDLIRGYRVDVEDEGVWRSLCERRVTYRVGRLNGPAATLTSGAEEGVVTAAAMQDVDPTKEDLFLHEALFHWDGWSLVAPRPGEVIQPDGLSHSENPGGDTSRNPSATSLELEMTAEPVEGSLPRLRFGHAYRMRARVVDVAGNSPPLSSTDDSEASEALVYRRFEPVEAPAVVIVSQKSLSGLPGESATRPVIRSYNPTPADDAVPSPETAERLLLPPRTSVQMIEQYGRLDTAQGVDASAAVWKLLAEKDAATIPEVVDDPGQIPAEVPYLADPFAVAAVLRGLPGAPAGSVHVRPFDAAPDWWQGKPFRVSTIEGDGAPSWDPSSRVLTVGLPKATVARVLMSSQIGPVDLDKLAVWKWIESAAFDEEERERLRKLALEGRHWMLTPFRELTLVHAVQQPLASPVIESLLPKKLAIGDTFATIEGSVAVHGPSTGKVDLLARWSEPTGHGFDRQAGEAHAFDVPVGDPQSASVPWGARRHEFGDTKYRRVEYYATATTRFRDYYPADLESDDLTRPPVTELPPWKNDSEHLFTAEVLSSGRPLAPNVLYVLPTFGWKAGADKRGTFSRRRGGLRLYFEEPWFSSGDGELLGVVVWPGKGDACVDGRPIVRSRSPVEVPAELQPYATQWGRDPIWLSGATQQVPSVQNFTRAVAVELGLTLEELKGRERSTVAVAGHEIGHDGDRNLFYCDLEIDAGDSYFPFVRLALVRYQPRSISGAELSRVVVADFAQLAPDRIVWVAREPDDPDRLRITVSGTGYRKNRSFDCTSTVEARLERWLGEGEGGIGWVPVSVRPIVLENVQALETLGLWQGSIRLPVHPPRARFRVVVEEYEAFLGDVPEVVFEDDRFGLGRERRLVYSDAVEVEPGGIADGS